MDKIGILTFHYSNNYGGVLQCFSLYKTLVNMGFNVEIVNFVPSSYNESGITKNLGIRKNILNIKREDINPIRLFKRIKIKSQYNRKISKKFNIFRESNLNLSRKVDENSIKFILNDYKAIIVGSDQVWNPSQWNRNEYFLDYGDFFTGKKISYAADSTIDEVDSNDKLKLNKSLGDFSRISVRNDHSNDFIKSILNKNVPIVVDPTLLYDFNSVLTKREKKDKYILAYILGKEIDGSHGKALKEIKNVYGNIPVYLIVIPTMKFDFFDCADKVMYSVGPEEWLSLFRNASFVYTDSYHGVIFSLKFHIPFIAYYTEFLRASRFVDLGKRYNIGNFIIQSTDDINKKKSLEEIPDFDNIDKLIEDHKKISLDFLNEALKTNKGNFFNN